MDLHDAAEGGDVVIDKDAGGTGGGLEAEDESGLRPLHYAAAAGPPRGWWRR
jgi:hypothetical protein